MFNRATRGWLNFLFANPELLELLQRQPSLAEKVHRPYLRKDLSAPRRLAALKTHYTISLQHTLRSLLLSAAHVEVEIASFCGKNGEIFRLALCPPGSLQKEGEVALRLDMADRVLYRLAFSLIAEDARQVIFIGSMQGPASGHDGGELVRAATKSLHGLRPRDLVIDVLQVLAESLGVTRIAGVGQAQHIYRHLRKQREFMQDYDRLWTELGGSRQADGTFDLPMTPVQRPLTEYPSKKRAEASRRQILERQVWEDVRRHATPEGAESDG